MIYLKWVGLFFLTVIAQLLAGWRWLETTVTPSNAASRRVFETLATRLNAQCAERTFFSKEDFQDLHHEPEMLIRIGPCFA